VGAVTDFNDVAATEPVVKEIQRGKGGSKGGLVHPIPLSRGKKGNMTGSGPWALDKLRGRGVQKSAESKK